MGLFDKIKQIKNFVTGGGATVSVRPAESVSNGHEPIKVVIEVQVQDTDINIRNVYLKIRAIEEVVARDVDFAREEDGELRSYQEDVTNTVETFDDQIEVSGPETLSAHETYEWETEFELPTDANGTYRGINAAHEWAIYAGLDMSGNDPDSGWVEIEIRK